MESNCCLKTKAFSLLELIIAVAMLSTGIIIILQAFSFCARAAGASGDYASAVFLGEDKIQEWEFKEKQNLIKEEVVNETADKFSLRSQTSLEPELGLYKLSLGISWERLGRSETIEINTYLQK